MKKQMKKLALSKETVRMLETGDLVQIAGGLSFDRPTCNNLSACNWTWCC
jgi:hypothetical protein